MSNAANIKFIGCLHLGDERLVTGLRGFSTSQEHDEHLIAEWNKVVTDTDTVYILGDISMEDTEHYYKLDLLNGKKIVVMGNHDKPEHARELLKHVDGLCGMKYLELDDIVAKQYKMWVTHAPLHPQELVHVGYNIHSHIHHMEIPYSEVVCDYWGDFTKVTTRENVGYINVDAMKLNYQPKTIKELVMIGGVVANKNVGFGQSAIKQNINKIF